MSTYQNNWAWNQNQADFKDIVKISAQELLKKIWRTLERCKIKKKMGSAFFTFIDFGLKYPFLAIFRQKNILLFKRAEK